MRGSSFPRMCVVQSSRNQSQDGSGRLSRHPRVPVQQTTQLTASPCVQRLPFEGLLHSSSSDNTLFHPVAASGPLRASLSRTSHRSLSPLRTVDFATHSRPRWTKRSNQVDKITVFCTHRLSYVPVRLASPRCVEPSLPSASSGAVPPVPFDAPSSSRTFGAAEVE